MTGRGGKGEKPEDEGRKKPVHANPGLLRGGAKLEALLTEGASGVGGTPGLFVVAVPPGAHDGLEGQDPSYALLTPKTDPDSNSNVGSPAPQGDLSTPRAQFGQEPRVGGKRSFEPLPFDPQPAGQVAEGPHPRAAPVPKLQRTAPRLGGVVQEELVMTPEDVAGYLLGRLLEVGNVTLRGFTHDALSTTKERVAAVTKVHLQLQVYAASVVAVEAARFCNDVGLAAGARSLEEFAASVQEHFKESCLSDERPPSSGTNASAIVATLGGRRGNEDRAVLLYDWPPRPTVDVMREHSSAGALVVVCDGHGGSECSQWVVDQLPLTFATLLQSRPPRQALPDAMHDVDARFAAASARQEAISCGCCCTAVWVTPEEYVIGHLGDTRAVLARKTGSTQCSSVRLTHDHTTDSPRQREEVVARGGAMLWSQGAFRVEGQLAVTRSLGDVAFRPGVSQEVDASVLKRERGDSFLVVASDGLWSVMSDQEVVDTVVDIRSAIDTGHFIRDSPSSKATSHTQAAVSLPANRSVATSTTAGVPQGHPYAEIADAIADYASERGRGDDVTIAVYFLDV
eukprot:Hpha_TRINITY_DN12623_c0_g1::TRINITY_DN12623_c0_g1_i1::g.49855::m.49855